MAEIQLCANKNVATGGIKLEQLVSECRKSCFRALKIKNTPGGACPQSPLRTFVAMPLSRPPKFLILATPLPPIYIPCLRRGDNYSRCYNLIK